MSTYGRRFDFSSAVLLLFSLDACSTATTAVAVSEADSVGVIRVMTTMLEGIPEVSSATPLTLAEPTIVADPEQPDHVIVAGTVEHRTPPSQGKWTGLHLPHGWIRVWGSVDGGRTWDRGRDLLPDVTGLFADTAPARHEFTGGDPEVAVFPGGRLAVTMILGDWFGADSGSVKNSGGPYEGLFVAEASPEGGITQLARLDMSGIPEALSYPHTPALFADRWKSSPFRGRIYLAHTGLMGSKHALKAAAFLRTSNDGGKSFSAPRELPGTRSGSPNLDLVVGPGGVIYAAWQGDSASFTMVSGDGGATFTTASRAFHKPAWPRLAVGEGGRNRGVVLLAIEYADRDAKPWRTTGLASVAAEDGSFREARSIDPGLPQNYHLRYPAPAVSNNAFWVLGYQMDSTATRVVLYRSTDRGVSWQVARVLAARSAARFRVGDYVGLAAAGNRLYAAYTLPTEDGKPGRVALYVSTIDVM
jgi:hypothetical protein